MKECCTVAHLGRDIVPCPPFICIAPNIGTNNHANSLKSSNALSPYAASFVAPSGAVKSFWLKTKYERSVFGLRRKFDKNCFDWWRRPILAFILILKNCFNLAKTVQNLSEDLFLVFELLLGRKYLCLV